MSSLMEVLLNHQTDLESSLADIDLLKLSKDLLKNRIFSRGANEKFTYLDPNQDHLEQEIKVRYLLQQVYAEIKEDNSLFSRLVKVLCRLRGEVEMVCRTMEEEMAKNSVDDKGARQISDVFLTSRDIPLLVNLIVAGSHKWEEIGIALGLPEYVREECRSAGNNPLRLSKLLSAWISGKYKKAKSTTIYSLKTALDGDIVQMSDVSQKLDSFLTHKNFPSTSYTSHFDGGLVIEYQSYDTEVTEGKSTLLEVQVGNRGCELYQWSKNGLPFVDGVDYSDVHSNILYINRASQSAEGKYSCCISRGSETKYTDYIYLVVLKLPLIEVNFIEFSNVLLQSEVISADIYDKFISLDQDHVTPETLLSFLIQQVRIRAINYKQVSDRLGGLVNRLEGITQTVCGVLLKELERVCLCKMLELDSQFSQSHSLLVQEILLPCTSGCEVSEGKSTLLKVLVSGGNEEGKSYQWSKDGEILLDGADFSGVCSNILYINRASQCNEGMYSCTFNDGGVTLYSNELYLKIIYPPDKKELLKYYSVTERAVPQSSWPPVGNPKCINLVLIRQKAQSKCDYYTIRGDMDDILESKEVTEYEKVFKEYREGSLVLVEGRPGSGKTTLVHKITRDWAAGKKILQRAKMVFLVTLRLLHVNGRDKSLLDILQIFYGEVFSKDIEHNLRKCKGEGACFILDGLDEYPIESKKKLIIDELLNIRALLPLSMVIVASRPVATDSLKKICQARIEVIGFSKDQIYSYVRTYPFKDSSLVYKIEAFLNQHPNVFHMCYLPIHAAMICFLFNELKGNIPHRETLIYEQFTIATILRHKTQYENHGTNIRIKSLKDLSGEEKNLFCM